MAQNSALKARMKQAKKNTAKGKYLAKHTKDLRRKKRDNI